jgi:hypothetical protein
MIYTLSGFALLTFLATAVLPVPRLRRLLLTALARMGQAALLAVLGACGTFFVDPGATPKWLTLAAAPLVESTLGLSLGTGSGLLWLVVAVLAVVVSLPVLMAIELGLSLSAQTVQVEALRKEIGQAAAWVDDRLTLVGISRPTCRVVPSEAAAATDALRSAGRIDSQDSAATPLVLDLLK